MENNIVNTNKNNNLNTLISAYDADSGEVYEITQVQINEAVEMHTRLSQSVIVTAVILSEIAENRHYLALGKTSFVQYVRDMTPFSETKAQKLKQIGSTFGPLLKSSSTKNVESNDFLLSKLESIGIEKVYAMSLVEGVDYTEIEEFGEYTLPSGERISIDEIKAMVTRDVEKRMKAERDKWRQRAEITDEKYKEQQAINAQKTSELDRIRASQSDAELILRDFGKQQLTIQKIETYLNRSTELMQRLHKEVYSIETDFDVPEWLVKRIVDFHFSLDSLKNTLREKNPYVFATAKFEDEVDHD